MQQLAFLYFDGVDDVSVAEFNLNGQYRLGEVMNSGGFDLYGLTGLNFWWVSTPRIEVLGTTFGGSAAKVGLNIGAGANFDSSEPFGTYAELK